MGVTADLSPKVGNNESANDVIDLDGISARYIGIEILSTQDATKIRVGLAEVAYTVAPSITENASGGLDETVTGSVAFTDANPGDIHTFSATYSNDAVYSGGTMTPAQLAAISTVGTNFTVDTSGWDYTVANADIEFVDEGETITLSFNVTVDDNSGAANATATKKVTLTINGVANFDTEVTLVGNTLTINDPDGDSNDNLAISFAGGVYTITDLGGLVLDAGSIPGAGNVNPSTVTVPQGSIDAINVATGGGTDAVTVNSTGSGVGVTIDGGADIDTVTWNSAVAIGSLDATADTINLDSGSVNSGGGDQTYTGPVVLGANATLAGGNVTFSDAVDLGSNQLTVAVTGPLSTADGPISGSGGRLVKEGAGTFTLAAPSDTFNPDLANLFISTSGTTVFTNTTVADVTHVDSGVMNGAFISPKNVPASIYNFTNNGTIATFTVAIAQGGFTKANKVQLSQSGSNVVATVASRQILEWKCPRPRL